MIPRLSNVLLLVTGVIAAVVVVMKVMMASALPSSQVLTSVGISNMPQPSPFDASAHTALATGEPGLSYRYVETFGETGVAYPSDTNHLNYPWGITTTDNSLWVAESWGLRLLNYTNKGEFLRAIGKAGFNFFDTTDLYYIADLAIDAQNNIWIAADNSKVIKTDPQGNVLTILSGTGEQADEFRSPVGIALDDAGNVYVSDGAQWWTTEESHHRVVIFDAAGNYLATIGDRDTPGSGNQQLQGPRHITIDQNLLYIADSGNHRVQIFDISTPTLPIYVNTIGVSSQVGTDEQHFIEPSGVAVDANFIYVADTLNQRVQLFQRSSRSYVATIGGQQGVGNEQFNYPSDVAVDKAGNIFVADFVNTRVQQYNASRQYVRTYGVAQTPYVSDGDHFNNPFGVDVGNDGSIYIAEERGQRVVKLNAAGVPQWTAGQAGIKNDWKQSDGNFSDAVDVAVGPDNRVYVVDRYGGRVQIFNQGGTLLSILYGPDETYFSWLSGIDVAADNRLYVTSDTMHALFIFDANLNHIATIGEPDVPGDNSTHLRDPWDVAVDNNGAIFVAERSNNRIKKCTRNGTSGTCEPWIGELGVGNNDFGYLGAPHRLAVDRQGKLYVTHDWYSRVDIFDATGGYLTSVGGAWGEQPGQFRTARGLAVDRNGDLYVTDIYNHRIQKFSPGVPGWVQTNINGFGNPQTQGVATLAVFQGALYAGTSSWLGSGTNRIMRSHDGKHWEEALGSNFGSVYHFRVNHLVAFRNQLYAGTRSWNWDTEQEVGGAIWRSANGTNWSTVMTGGFGDPANGTIHQFAVFSDTLYAGTWSSGLHGAEIWRSNSGNSDDWTQVVDNGLGDASNGAVMSFAVFHGALYAAIYNADHGAEIWRTDNGVNWTKAMSGGFDDPDNEAAFSLAMFDDALYVGISNYHNSDNPGAELWRCRQCDGDDWQQVPIAKGFGDADNFAIENLFTFGDSLYALTGNEASGMDILRSNDGTDWNLVGADGLGDSNNYYPYYDNGVATWQGQLYAALWNQANGGEVWMYTDASSGQVTPEAGGGLSNQTNGITLTFPISAVAVPVNLAYNKLTVAGHPLPTDTVGVRYFTLSAADEGDNPVTQFQQPYTMTLTYSDEELLRARADEATLACIYWDQMSNEWGRIKPDLDDVMNKVVCRANHFTEFALASGKSPLQFVFLPVVTR